MSKIVKDVAKGELPLAVAYAEEAVVDESGMGTHYSTYTTASGVQQALDDSPVKDEDQ